MHLIKPLLFFVFFIAFFKNGYTQDSISVRWETSVKKISEKKYEIKIRGEIKNGWHLYAAPDAAEGIAGILVSFDDSAIIKSSSRVNATFKDINDPVFENRKKNVATGNIEIVQQLSFANEIPPALRLQINYDLGNQENFIPEEQTFKIILNEAAAPVVNRILIPSINIQKPLTRCGDSASPNVNPSSHGLSGLFFLGFLGGLVALLTPCVFPMIPLTVSFFTKKASSKRAGISNAFLYGFFIFLIYILLSLPFHFLDKLNPEILNNISTNVYLNIFFFAIFIFFAFSFFGYYDIMLPAGLQGKADSKAGAGNIAGIFFMALTLALVSFSCTGPILGSLLAGSLTSDGGAMQLTAGMGGFGLALALPFALFALFPNWLNSLPKSGGWLNTVKVVLGFLELALALKFLSNADLVMHWNFLKREIFIGIWIGIGMGLTAYLFGLIRFRHDNPALKLSRLRIFLGIISAAFTIYLIPGITNTKFANLGLISGFPPPLYYSVYKKSSDCVLDLNCTRDYETGLAMARKENKPILLDFTGYACVNCRRMEENVWINPEIYQLMKERFIVISLYVDDKKKLPVAQQFTYATKEGTKREIRTIGDKWSAFETENFLNNAQPLYAILNTDEVLLTYPIGYTPSAKEYLSWLQCGAGAFYKK